MNLKIVQDFGLAISERMSLAIEDFTIIDNLRVRYRRKG